MKKGKKCVAVLLSALMIISSSIISGSAITVEKDGKEYFLRSHTPTTGDCKVLMIRLGFADYGIDDENYPADSEETLLSYFDGSKGSVNEFYETSSYGKLRLSCDKVYSYTAKLNQDDYQYIYDDPQSGINSLVTEALYDLEDEINYDEYDSDGDGYLDFVCFDFAGHLSQWAGTWWPQILKSDGINVGDKKVNLYAILQGEANVFIHELGHLLGAADYYSIGGRQNETIMTYDIMCSNSGDHNGFTKWSYGWLDNDDIAFVDKSSGDTTIELNPIESTLDGKKIAVVAPELNGSFLDEYFLVEYDSGTGNNAEVFEEKGLTPGFRIFHVNASSSFKEDLGVIDYDKNNFSFRDNLIHNVKNEYSEDSSWADTSDNMFYREGDVLSYDTTPNTGFSLDGTYNGLFTGISFTDFVTGDKPSLKVSFTDDYSPAEQPNLTLSYDALEANMAMVLSSDKPLSLAMYEDVDEIRKHEPYLIDKDGNKYIMDVSSQNYSLFKFDVSYFIGYLRIQPNTEFTFVIPEGYFLTDYNEPVSEFRQTIKSGDFMQLTTVSTSYSDSVKLRSAIFAVTDKTYGIIDASNANNNGNYTFNEYNLNGEIISSCDFKAPDFETDDAEQFFECNVFNLNDGNYALEMCSDNNFYFVKINRSGKILSKVFRINREQVSLYTYAFSDEELNPYKDGLCKLLVSDDYENKGFLIIDFVNEPTIENTNLYFDYYSIDSETYAITRYSDDDDKNHLIVYDKSDKQISDIPVVGLILGAFEENGYIKILTESYDFDTDSSSVCISSYSKNGQLLESKDIIETAKKINEYGYFDRCIVNKNGYFFTHTEGIRTKLVAYDKSWNYVGDMSFDDYVHISFVGNCGLIKENRYFFEQGECEIISRFNIGDVEIVQKPKKISISKTKISSIKNKTYTGKAIKQSLTLTYNGKKLVEGTDYTVSYSNNKKVGTASVTIKGKGDYTGSVKKTFKIKKAANTIKVTKETKSINAKLLKTKSRTVKPLTISKAKGTVTVKTTSVKFGKEKISVKKFKLTKTGILTVKKGKYKKGTYKVTVKITAKGNSNYKSKTVNNTVTIKIK